MKARILTLALLACIFSCSNAEADVPAQNDIKVNPQSLECAAEGGTLSLGVTADAAWQAYADDDCSEWVLKVDPAYSADPVGTVSVKVDENIGRNDRSGNIVIKCGTTRLKVPITQKAPEASPIKCPLDGYSLVWHDEFEGSDVETKNWKFENWTRGWVNNELQYYVAGGEFDGVQTAFIKDEALQIKAQKYKGSKKFTCNGKEYDIDGQVISARMNTKESWLYGYFEAAIWLPKGKGTWPAFWMMPTDQSDGWPVCGEIDIMEEVGVDANITSSSIHTGAYNHPHNTQKTQSRTTNGAESEYHVYALEWTADYLQFYTDGIKTLKFQNDGKKDKDTWPFNKKFYMTLNLAWGGDWGGYAGVDESALPCTMKVDWVRVFQK